MTAVECGQRSANAGAQSGEEGWPVRRECSRSLSRV